MNDVPQNGLVRLADGEVGSLVEIVHVTRVKLADGSTRLVDLNDTTAWMAVTSSALEANYWRQRCDAAERVATSLGNGEAVLPLPEPTPEPGARRKPFRHKSAGEIGLDVRDRIKLGHYIDNEMHAHGAMFKTPGADPLALPLGRYVLIPEARED